MTPWPDLYVRDAIVCCKNISSESKVAHRKVGWNGEAAWRTHYRGFVDAVLKQRGHALEARGLGRAYPPIARETMASFITVHFLASSAELFHVPLCLSASRLPCVMV